MGNCLQTTPKLNGIIDNQSAYEIIYHVSGSMKDLAEYEEQLNIGPKVGVGLDKIQMEGVNYNKKKHSKNAKYFSEARVPKHSFCSAGLNNIEVGCFLSIYAAKSDHYGNEVYKKLIFKDICIRTNEDICLRINKDLTIKQLTASQIIQMKAYFQNTGSKIIPTLKQTTDIFKQQSQSVSQSIANRLKVCTQYLQKIFGSDYKYYYVQSQQTGLYDLNHMDKKLNIHEFLKYDWVYVQSLELDGCGIDDDGWFLIVQQAKFYFPNLKNLYLGDNSIRTILEGDLQQFPSLKMVQFGNFIIIMQDYGEDLGVNPLTEESKKYLFYYALEHPQICIYCSNIDENKYMKQNLAGCSQIFQNTTSDNQNPENVVNLNQNDWTWFAFYPPEANQARNQTSMIRKSKKSTGNNLKKISNPKT